MTDWKDVEVAMRFASVASKVLKISRDEIEARADSAIDMQMLIEARIGELGGAVQDRLEVAEGARVLTAERSREIREAGEPLDRSEIGAHGAWRDPKVA